MVTPMSEAAWPTDSWNSEAAGRTKTIIDLPVVGVLTDSALIDLVIAEIFDQLGQAVIELRISAVAGEPTSSCSTCALRVTLGAEISRPAARRRSLCECECARRQS